MSEAIPLNMNDQGLVTRGPGKLRTTSVLFSVSCGVLSCLFGAFPAAMIMSMFYRFPGLMYGYISIPELIGTKGIAEVVSTLPRVFLAVAFSVFLMGVMGWYVILALVGGIGGWFVRRAGHGNYRAVLRANVTMACVVDFLFAIAAATMPNPFLFPGQQ